MQIEAIVAATLTPRDPMQFPEQQSAFAANSSQPLSQTNQPLSQTNQPRSTSPINQPQSTTSILDPLQPTTPQNNPAQSNSTQGTQFQVIGGLQIVGSNPASKAGMYLLLQFSFEEHI